MKTETSQRITPIPDSFRQVFCINVDGVFGDLHDRPTIIKERNIKSGIMGMLDDLLGGDRDKKERDEMRENIERIRQKVQDREGAPQPPQEGGRERQPPAPQRDDRTGQRSPAESQEQQSRGQQRPTPPPGMAGQQEDRSGQADRGHEQRSGRARQERAPSRSEQTGRERRGRGRQSTSQSGSAQQDREQPQKSSMPEPPEVKELDIPDIEKGPLFITVKKFRQAIRTIAELEQVAQELESSAASMENTLAEDREMNDAIRTRLEEAEEKANVVRNIVSP